MVFKAINEFIFGKKFVNFDEFLSEVKKTGKTEITIYRRVRRTPEVNGRQNVYFNVAVSNGDKLEAEFNVDSTNVELGIVLSEDSRQEECKRKMEEVALAYKSKAESEGFTVKIHDESLRF